MSIVFLDTGYILVLELKHDQHHIAAQQHWEHVRTALPQIVTTTYVFDEVVTYLNSRGYHAKAVQVGNNLLRSPSVQMVHVEETLFQEAWTHFQRYQDKQFSLTDCISFVVMQQRSITNAFTFDNHFTQAGFSRLP
jgi:predicted nucleic acid-binding protein